MRKPIVGISMKTYQNNFSEASLFTESLIERVGNETEVDVFYCPSIGLLHSLSLSSPESNLGFGAQNIGMLSNGPQTGEFSIEILESIGGKYVEIGHAERKEKMGETYEMIAQKLALTLSKELIPVLCIGDKKKVDDETLRDELMDELEKSLSKVRGIDVSSLVIAYEPVWAIGASESADASYVWNAHSIIREIISELYSDTVAQSVRIIYGGSVMKETTKNIMSDPNVDGVFVGRFGHNPDNFEAIVSIVKEKIYE